METIVQEGNPVLREEALEVASEEFNTPELRTLLKKMNEALEAEHDGVALAAPQIGVSKRIFIVRYDRLVAPPEGVVLPADVGVYINPEFTRTSRKREVMDEGCLSVRRIYGKTYRFIRATVRAQNEDGSFFERGGGGLLAQIFQHETDHLNGFLFTDHADELYEMQPRGKNKATIENLESDQIHTGESVDGVDELESSAEVKKHTHE